MKRNETENEQRDKDKETDKEKKEKENENEEMQEKKEQKGRRGSEKEKQKKKEKYEKRGSRRWDRKQRMDNNLARRISLSMIKFTALQVCILNSTRYTHQIAHTIKKEKHRCAVRSKNYDNLNEGQ